MTITDVTYGHLFNLGNYENERFEATAIVTIDQTAEEAMAELRAWVMAQGTQERRQRDADREQARLIEHKSEELHDLERELAALQQRIDNARAFLKATGIPEPASWDVDDIPF